jgi:F-type H+-transporting ATPase subunit gamma
MAKTRALVKRRRAIRNIRKITRTMELIATSRFKRAMDRAIQAEAFTRKIVELVGDLSATATDVTHPLLQTHEKVQNAVVLVLGSNRGLCGGYNAGILRAAVERLRELRDAGISLHLELSGKRPITWFRFQGIPAEQKFTHFEDRPTFGQVEEIANRYIAAYTAGEIDRVDVAYQKFITAARQMPVVETLLPLSSTPADLTPARHAKPAEPAKPAKRVEYEFLPSARDILEELLPVSFKVRLFKCFLDAAVSEQIARRVTMKAATENADEMIKTLSSLYNRARQAAITKEISEVIGGAEALTK